MFDKKNILPMLLQEVPIHFSNKYLYEIKFDGIRAIIYVSKSNIVIKSRNNNDLTRKFPELKAITNIVSKNCIFDGEIISFDNKFSSIQKRLRLKNDLVIKDYALENPVIFMVFDIIYENKDLTNKPLLDRKKILDKYDDTNYFIKSRVYSDGEKLFERVKKLGLEGIVAKEKNSLYYPNTRSNEWIKLKNYQTDSFYIGGYIKNKVGISLLLGEYINNKLYYVGKISVSKTNDLVKQVLSKKVSNNYFVNYQEKGIFIKPSIKITVNYLEKTKSNMLRHPFI